MGKQTLHIPDNQGGVGLLVYLRGVGVSIASDCGGNGTCGKCAVEIINGVFPFAADTDRAARPGETVPACKLLCPPSGGEIKVQNCGAVTTPLLYPDALRSAGQSRSAVPCLATAIESIPPSAFRIPHSLDIAIDVGTTTIEAALVDTTTGEVIHCAACLNPQRTFGADVISRISASESHLEEMSEAVRSACAQLVSEMTGGVSSEPVVASLNQSEPRVKRICFVGNPTMLHILRSVSPAGMGMHPFTMAFSGEVREPADKYGFPGAEAVFPTAISSFIGSDVTCGVIATGLDLEDLPALYIDAGTNGEMVLFAGRKSGGEFFATSAAAGPALEGARIECGTGGVNGAICAFGFDSTGKTHLKTVGNKPPRGICGSGLVDVIACLFEKDIIDSTGCMSDNRYIIPGGGGAYITQNDVREFQLAKGALRAGIETLLEETGTKKDDIGKIILAGNLGKYMNLASAVSTGIIPAELSNCTIQCGNGALNGAISYLTDGAFRDRVSRSSARYRTLELNNSRYFEKEFIRQMNF